MLEHFHKSARCKAIVLELEDLPREVISEVEAREADVARKLYKEGQRRHCAQAPVVRCSGPLTWAAHVAGIEHVNLLRTGKPPA